jgi:hypothetical protein
MASIAYEMKYATNKVTSGTTAQEIQIHKESR